MKIIAFRKSQSYLNIIVILASKFLYLYFTYKNKTIFFNQKLFENLLVLASSFILVEKFEIS
jgi:chromosome condensin MukBEF MukE localization factor